MQRDQEFEFQARAYDGSKNGMAHKSISVRVYVELSADMQLNSNVSESAAEILRSLIQTNLALGLWNVK